MSIIAGFPFCDDNCKGCGKPLLVENAWMTDGCPCNSDLGVNSMNETRWRLLMQLQQRQKRELDDAVADAVQFKAIGQQFERDARKHFEKSCEWKQIVDQLPTTADGVPIVPDMLVYVRAGEHVDERKVIGPYGKQSLLTHEPARHGACAGHAHRLCNVCYSTREAAAVAVS